MAGLMAITVAKAEYWGQRQRKESGFKHAKVEL